MGATLIVEKTRQSKHHEVCIYLFILTGLIPFFLYEIIWWPQLEPGSSAQKLWCGLYMMVSEFLIGRLGEFGLLPWGEIAVSHRDGFRSGLGEVAQGGSAVPS